MIENVKITFVLYATNLEYAQKTYQSLKKQDMSDVRLVLVIDGKEQQLVSDLKELIGKNAIYVSVDERSGIGGLREHLGGLVFFLKEGVLLKGNTAARIKASFDKLADGDRQRCCVLVPTAIDKKNPVSVEYDEFVQAKERDLDTDYNMLCRMYYAHGIFADAIVWDEEGSRTDEDIELSMIRLVSVSVCRARRVHIVQGGSIWIENFRYMTKALNTYMETYEGIAIFGQQFFMPLCNRLRQLGLSDSKNGQYLLLYYCSYVFNAITALEGQGMARPEGIEQMYVDMLLELPDFDILAMHPYVTAVLKYVILKNYFPSVRPGQSKAADLILDARYRYVSLREIKPGKDKICLEFLFLKLEDEAYDLFCVVNGKEYPCKKGFCLAKVMFWDRHIATRSVYTVEIERTARMNISFARKEKGKRIPFETIMFQKTVPLSNKVFLYKKLKGMFYYADQTCQTVCVRRANPVRAAALFTKHIRSMMAYGKAGYKALGARGLYHIQKLFDKREVWLLTDRANRADDNGEVMFRYLRSLGDTKKDFYFVIDAHTPDNRRMRAYGKTVAPFSWKHKMLYLRNTVTMSSQANKMVVNPFGNIEHLYRDIVYDKKLVFLQHGVTKDNQSKWLNKYNRNLYGFVVNTKAEYDSVFTYDYFYTPERVWLTGMPRFDRLYHDEQNYITIMPTWRKSLSNGTDENGVWLLGDDFKESQYFRFYNALLNDDRLIQAAKRLGYTICFMPHPNTIMGLKQFNQQKGVLFFDTSKSYREVFAQTNLMVTDYSSVAFDFAYLRKPIIYCQFDREEFFNGEHSYTEGYFDYDRDGFGPVTQKLDDTVDAVIRAMESGCQLEDMYRQRIDATFAFDDSDCCKRVLERFEKERQSERGKK